MPDFDLRGKEFFSEAEAAHYCCISYSHFRRHVEKLGLESFEFLGKRVYSKASIDRVLAKAQKGELRYTTKRLLR